MSEACKLIFLIASVLKDPPELKFFKKSNCGPRYRAKRDGQSDSHANSILHRKTTLGKLVIAGKPFEISNFREKIWREEFKPDDLRYYLLL